MAKKADYPRPAFAVRLNSALKVQGFTSKEETRYYLHGASFEAAPDGGAVIAATDGHRLGVSHDHDGLVLESVIARLPATLKPTKMLVPDWLVGILTGPGKGYISIVRGMKTEHRDDDALHAIDRVDDCDLRIGFMMIDGTFPDWRRIVPTPKSNATLHSFNRDYLRSFGKQVTLIGDGENEPRLVQTDDSDFIGVLMPMRAERRGVPDWINAEPKKKAA